MGNLLTFLAIAVALYVLVIASTYWVQGKMMYFPDPERTHPEDVGLRGVREVTLKTADGQQLIAWWGKAKPGQPTLLYFHGNAGSLAMRAERIAKYLELGRGVFILSYRGYAGSTGAPSERANVADAKLSYDWLIENGVAADDVILYGESLGSGIAVQVAAEKQVGGIVLDAPYTSIVDVGARCYPYLPVRTLMTDRYNSLEHIGAVTAPLLVIHGEEDQIIPVDMGRTIAEMSSGPAKLVTFARAGHTDHHLYGSFQAVQSWIEDMRAARSGGKDAGRQQPRLVGGAAQ